jgi:8-oxo-dGTP pyrophosphatase MutT (NUDIX family)
MSNADIKAASTVLIFQKNNPWPSPILLLKRSQNAAFLPGAYVFPGGQLDEDDKRQAPELAKNSELIHRIRRYFEADAQLIAAHVAAAVRETYEEAGLLINTIDLWPISWWVTPPGETRRFDTWFFLAGIEESPHEAMDSLEVMTPLWLKPHEALEAYENAEIFIPPPTRAILERMANTGSLAEFLSMVDQPLRPIHPRFVLSQGQKLLILPGHELHPEAERSHFILHTSYRFP